MSSNYRKKEFTGKRKKKKTGVSLKHVLIVLGTAAVFVGAGYVIYSHLPFVKVNSAIAAGDKYAEAADYEAAIDSYRSAIEIDETSVTAYSNMAGAYLSIDDKEAAKQALYEGYIATGNEGLFDNYHAVILNEAVEAINSDSADLNTVSDIVGVLEEDPERDDAIGILNDAYTMVFGDAYGYDRDALFRSDSTTYGALGEGATYSYDEYEKLIGRMLDLYAEANSDDLKSVIVNYATPSGISFTMGVDDAVRYSALLDKVLALGTDDTSDTSMKECLDNMQSVLAVFSGIFEQLDVGNVDELRGFVVSDEYLALRDIFLHEEYTPQENTVYVPISREAVVLNCTDGSWSYRFLDFDENPTTAGVITLWANFFEDDGVQRDVISYEPASVAEGYYPHTEYTVTYLRSYITSGTSSRVAGMNYRLETRITNEDGNIIDTVIGDWGGEKEWEMNTDLIESRIRA